MATTLDSRCVAARWVACERALSQSVRRVDDWHERGVRVDTMTAVASVTPAGMCQLGYSKEHHPDLLPVKSAVSGLDPLGSPWTTTVVVGHTSDTPISLPEIA